MIRLRDILKSRIQGQEERLLVDMPDPADDEALFLLMEELGGLGEVRVPAAARQRGWAKVRAEVRTRQARGAFSSVGVRLRGMVQSRRLALSSTAALVAIALGVVAVLQWGEPGSGPGVVDTSVTTATTALADVPSTTQGSSITTGGTSNTTEPVRPSTTAPVSSSTSITTGGATNTTAPPPATNTTAPPPATNTTAPRTSTTLPASTTTSQQLMTAQERERSAKAASSLLAAAVVSGDSHNTVAVLSSSAGRGLATMVSVLQDPQTYGVLSVEDVDPLHTRVLVQFIDRTRDAQGRIVDVAARFLFELKVDTNGAVIIGIYAAPAE